MCYYQIWLKQLVQDTNTINSNELHDVENTDSNTLIDDAETTAETNSSELSDSGFNFRMTDIASALGRSQLKKVDSFIARREQIARFYDEIFDNNPHFDTLLIPSYIKSSRHLYPIFLKQKYFCSKEEIFQALQKEGLGVQVHYKPIHLYSLYSPYSPLYMAEAFYKAEISIPCHQKMTQEDAKITAEKIFSVFQSLQICKA